MKRGTINHPKMAMLEAYLGVEHLLLVGILESLWHFASEYAKRGDIGRYSDTQIAAAIRFNGDPTKLVKALVDSKWLDEHEKHRLIIHDWSSHCDDGVRNSLFRAGITRFADGKVVEAPRLSKADKDKIQKNLRTPKKVPPKTTRRAHEIRTAKPKPEPSHSQSLSPSQANAAPAPNSDSPARTTSSNGTGRASGPERRANGTGGMIGSGGLGAAFNREAAELDRQFEVQKLLASVDVNSAVQQEISIRKDVTPARVQNEIERIRGDPKVDNVGAVLVSRLRARAPANSGSRR